MNPTLQKVIAGFKEGEDNDWAPAVDGYIQMEYNLDFLRQQINARLQTLPNEVDGFDGIDYVNVIFGNTDFHTKAQALISVIKNTPLVKDVAFVSANWVDKKAGVFQFIFSIQSQFGDLFFSMGIDNQQRSIVPGTFTES